MQGESLLQGLPQHGVVTRFTTSISTHLSIPPLMSDYILKNSGFWLIPIHLTDHTWLWYTDDICSVMSTKL